MVPWLVHESVVVKAADAAVRQIRVAVVAPALAVLLRDVADLVLDFEEPAVGLFLFWRVLIVDGGLRHGLLERVRFQHWAAIV